MSYKTKLKTASKDQVITICVIYIMLYKLKRPVESNNCFNHDSMISTVGRYSVTTEVGTRIILCTKLQIYINNHS